MTITNKWIFLRDVTDFKMGEVINVDEYFNIELSDNDNRDPCILRGLRKMPSIKLEEYIITLAEWRDKQIDEILK